MNRRTPRLLVEIAYYDAAKRFQFSLGPKHFSEAVSQATQRKITLSSLELVHAKRSDVQVFNELLVQYPVPGLDAIGQVLPDNTVILQAQPVIAEISFDVPLQPARPFWVFEYISKHNCRKDYDENVEKYEQQLQVPYCMLFNADTRDLTLYKMSRRRYQSVKPNKDDRLPLPELDIEIGLLNEWVRFWYQGELLPLPGDMLREIEKLERSVEREREARLAAERELAELRRRLGGK